MTSQLINAKKADQLNRQNFRYNHSHPW